jgi:hypothetical protein
MKKTFYILAILITGYSIQSCSKSVDTATKQLVINTAVAAGEVYNLNLASYGTTAIIRKQATDFSTSQISRIGGSLVYQYASSVAKTAAADTVVLAVTNGKRNCGPADSTIITVNISGK